MCSLNLTIKNTEKSCLKHVKPLPETIRNSYVFNVVSTIQRQKKKKKEEWSNEEHAKNTLIMKQ